MQRLHSDDASDYQCVHVNISTDIRPSADSNCAVLSLRGRRERERCFNARCWRDMEHLMHKGTAYKQTIRRLIDVNWRVIRGIKKGNLLKRHLRNRKN